MTEETNTFSKRAKRYASVTKNASSTTFRLLASKYLGIKIDEEMHAEDIKKMLSNLRGPLMKIAQILSTIPGILPEAYEKELAELQSNAPPMGKLFVKRRMRGELGDGWQENFQTFNLNASFAASLGQVHIAETSKEKLACKLQYPDMSSAIEADLKQLKLFFKIFETRSGINTKNIYTEVSERLREELDYTQELDNMKLFQKIFKKTEFIYIPEAIEKLSTSKLLTMQWLDGCSIKDFFDTSLEQRNDLAQKLFHAWYMPLYHYGVIHGDPHLGNYTVRQDNTLNLLDFGCIRIFPGAFVQGIIDLYKALLKNDKEMMVHAYETWGFKDLNNDLIDALENWARYVYDPLLEDRVRKIQEHGGPEHGKEVALATYKQLQKNGGIQPPQEFVFVDRAAVGLGSAFLRLQAELNWHQMFEALIEGFDSKKVDKRQKSLKN